MTRYNPTTSGVTVAIDGDVATVTLPRFGIDAFPMFLRCKAVPEKTLGYDWRTDTYTVTMPARFAAMLGETPPASAVAPLPIADHLFDYQRFVLSRALDARRYAAWLETGLGKAIIDLEWARQVIHLTGGRVIYFVPTVELIRQIGAQVKQFYGDAFSIEPLRSREAVVRWCCEPGPGAAVATYHVMVAGIMPELRRLGGWVTTEEWIRDAHGVWTDIREMDVLEGWGSGREEDDEKHVCPLQLEVIRRLVKLYTNPGETVLDPFMGIGSVAHVAVEQGRSALGFELKESYHTIAERNGRKALAAREQGQDQLPLLALIEASQRRTLFDLAPAGTSGADDD